MKPFVPFVGLLLMLSACAAPKLDQNFVFSKDNPNGIVAVLEPRILNNSTATLRRIDLEKKQFTRRNYILGDNKTVKTPAYRMREVPPGVYALVAISTRSQIGFRTYINNKCYTPAIEMFQVFPGTVNAAEIGKMAFGDQVQSPDLDKILAPYRGITAPIRQAKLIGYASVKGLSCRSLIRDDVKLKLLIHRPKKLTVAENLNFQNMPAHHD